MTRPALLRRFPLLLLAAALLLALPSVHDAPTAQAQAQTEVWSATLTARDMSSEFNGLGCNLGSEITAAKCSNTSTLTDNTVTVGTDTYTIRTIRITSGGLTFGFDSARAHTILNGYVLYVDDTPLKFADSVPSGGSAGDALWTAHGLSWSAGDSVSLRLTRLPPQCKSVPDAPAFTAATPGSDSVALAWNPSARQYGVPVTDYIVTIWDSADALVTLQTFIASDDASATYTETVSGLTASTAYTAQVRARNILGCRSDTGERTFTTTAPVGGL